MRLGVTTLRRAVKGDLRIQFVRHQVTSYSGLELLRRYLRHIDLPARLGTACAGLGGDHGSVRFGLLVLALFRGHAAPGPPAYLAGDLLVASFCGLARIPTPRTVAKLAAPVHPGER